MNKEKKIRNVPIKKGIYVLPNLFTTASLFAGFYSIVSSIQEKFVVAAVSILLSMLLDALDGRIARFTNTTSKFGAEYDSLADLIAFGMAPAILAYIWSMSFYDKGWMAGFMFVARGALRLARFNIQIGIIDSKFFNGLPIPAAASVVATTVIFFDHIGVEGTFHSPYIMPMVIILSLLMVSNIKYYSGKDMKLFARMPFVTFSVLLVILWFLILAKEVAAFIIMVSYAISGPIWLIIKILKKIHHRDTEEKKISQQTPKST